MPIPTQDLRTNYGTWAVRACQLPAIGHFMHDALPNEEYDPHFYGQALETTYLDTQHFDLRKARLDKDKYLTLRVRCYAARDLPDAYALSAKTEDQKFRAEIPDAVAEALVSGEDVTGPLGSYLPGDLLARLLELTSGKPVRPVVRINCQRYAIEDDEDRFTLDVDVRTDLGKVMPYGVLEFKSTQKKTPPKALLAIGLHPLKLSKFLWSTRV
jgi:hypothetical protein